MASLVTVENASWLWGMLPVGSIIGGLLMRIFWVWFFNYSPFRRIVEWYPCICMVMTAIALAVVLSIVALYPHLGN